VIDDKMLSLWELFGIEFCALFSRIVGTRFIGDLRGALRETGDTKESSAVVRSSANFRAYTRQYTPDLRSIKRKSIMPLRRLAVSGWRRSNRALICFSVYSRPGFDVLDDVLEHGQKLLPLHRKLP